MANSFDSTLPEARDRIYSSVLICVLDNLIAESPTRKQVHPFLCRILLF